MYNASRGNIKTVKHIELGIFTKRKTGSKLLINCLNRLGHSISYSDVNKIETDIANRQLINGNLRTCVPGGLQPGKLITFVYDNCDQNPESIFGSTVHCTNGIAIQQHNKLGEPLQSVRATEPEYKGRRSFTPIEYVLEPYICKERENPPVIHHVERGENTVCAATSKSEDMLWCLSRCLSEHLNNQQHIPNWTGI